MPDPQALAVAAAQARAMRDTGLTPGPMDEPTWPVPTMPKPKPFTGFVVLTPINPYRLGCLHLNAVPNALPTWYRVVMPL